MKSKISVHKVADHTVDRGVLQDQLAVDGQGEDFPEGKRKLGGGFCCNSSGVAVARSSLKTSSCSPKIATLGRRPRRKHRQHSHGTGSGRDREQVPVGKRESSFPAPRTAAPQGGYSAGLKK